MNDARLNIIALTTMLLAVASLAGSAQEESRVQTVVFDRAVQPGEVVRLDVTCDCEPNGATATVFGQDVPLFPMHDGDAWRGLIGIDLDISPGTYPIAVVVDQVGQVPIATTRELVVVTKRYPVRQLRVPARFVNPPANAIERIQDEAHRLQAIFETVTRPRQWHRSFLAPARAPTSGSFGTRSVFNGQPRSPHSGLDFRSKAWTPVAAPATGVVTIAESLFFTGNTVVIDHGLGLYSLTGAPVEVRGTGGRPRSARTNRRLRGRDRACDGSASALERAPERRPCRSAVADRGNEGIEGEIGMIISHVRRRRLAARVVLVATLFSHPAFAHMSSGQSDPANISALVPVDEFSPAFLGMYRKVLEIDGDIVRYSRNYGVDPSLARAVCMYESGGNANLTSGAGAGGYFQVMPATFRLMRVPTNIEAGIVASSASVAGEAFEPQHEVRLTGPARVPPEGAISRRPIRVVGV